MAELVDLEDAARILGISPEELVEHRSRGDISGLRSGTSWKFKQSEIDRFRESLAELQRDENSLSWDDDLSSLDLPSANTDSPSAASLEDDLTFSMDDDDLPPIELDDDDSAESVLVSEHELGRSDGATASTIIGPVDVRLGVDALAGESDLKIGGLEPPEPTPPSNAQSDVELASASDVLADEFAVEPPSANDLKLSQSNPSVAPSAASDDDFELDLDVPASGHASGFSSLRLAGDSSKVPAAKGGTPPAPSAAPQRADDEERISLDDDMMLDIGGSDVTLDASASGINLGRPSDSGLSLEDAMLELDAKGDSAFLGSGISLSDEGEGSSDDEFLLTPIENSAALEEEGSGSQVIELEDDFSSDDAESAVELLEDSGALELDEDDVGLSEVGPAGVSGAAPLVAAGGEGSDSEYSLGSILLLCSLAGVMLISTFMVSDIVRSIWAFEEPFSVTNQVMDLLTSPMRG